MTQLTRSLSASQNDTELQYTIQIREILILKSE
eukprot:COSAG02_NODE_48210_length_335_cov_0.889831_1_plen_32_part_10